MTPPCHLDIIFQHYFFSRPFLLFDVFLSSYRVSQKKHIKRIFVIFTRFYWAMSMLKKIYLKTEIHIFILSTEPLMRYNREARYFKNLQKYFTFWMTRIMLFQQNLITLNFLVLCWIQYHISYKIFPKTKDKKANFIKLLSIFLWALKCKTL